MDVFPTIRAQSPTGDRARGAEGVARLRAAVEAFILSLLALLGRRALRAWQQAPLPLDLDLDDDCGLDDWWIELPEFRPANRHRTIHDGTHLVLEHPILYVFGPGPNPGMRPHARTAPTRPACIARGPPLPALIP